MMAAAPTTGALGRVRTRLAEERDVPRLVQVVNLAYRGYDPTVPAQQHDPSKTGIARAWTTEYHLVGGPRATHEQLRQLATSDPAERAFYVAEANTAEDAGDYKEGEGGQQKEDKWEVVGCALVEKCEDGGHLGMFAVDPMRQAMGIGRLLLAVGEQHVWETFGADLPVVLHVVSVRPELLAYYMRRGYVDTKERAPFPASDYPPLVPEGLEFCVLKKYRPTS